MALKQCPECKREVSERVKRCPHCGFKKPPAVSPVFAIFLILVVCLIAAVAIMLVVHTQQTNRAKAQLDKTLRDADRMIQVYNRLSSPTPSPRPPPVAPAYESRRQTKAATETTPPPPPPQFVTITEPVSVGRAALHGGTPFVGLTATFFRGVSAGSAVLPAGTRLDFVSRVGSDVYIRYKGGEYIIPISATDLK
jgi:hypothetical protein